MPTIADIPLHLSFEEVRRAWGPQRVRMLAPALATRLQQLLDQVNAGQSLGAAINYHVREITAAGPDWIEIGRCQLNSAMLAGYLQHATHLVFGVCTLGQKLLRQMRDCFDSSKQLQAVLLDEIGTLLLYKLGDHFEDLMCKQAGSMGLQASGAFNPGDDDFDIGLQGTILELAGGAEIGVTLQGSSILVPHKSLTAVIGLGRDMPTYSHADRCERCRSRERCPHRQYLIAGTGT